MSPEEQTEVTRSGTWFLYLIECIDGSIYTGITKDVEARYAAHAAGKGARYTRSHPPAKLLAMMEYADLKRVEGRILRQATNADRKAPLHQQAQCLQKHNQCRQRRDLIEQSRLERNEVFSLHREPEWQTATPDGLNDHAFSSGFGHHSDVVNTSRQLTDTTNVGCQGVFFVS